MNTSFGENHATLSEMTEDLGELVDSLKIQAAATEAFNEEALEKLSRSINKTLTTTLNTDTVVSRADSTVDEATKVLEDHKAEKVRLETQSTHRNAEYKQRASSSHAALERAARLLASARPKEPGGFLSSYTTLMQ